MSTGQMELWPAVPEDPRRSARIAALLQRERWRVDEVAYYLRCSVGHVSNNIDCGNLAAINIATDPNTRPMRRVFRDSVLTFEKNRMEGGQT